MDTTTLPLDGRQLALPWGAVPDVTASDCDGCWALSSALYQRRRVRKCPVCKGVATSARGGK